MSLSSDFSTITDLARSLAREHSTQKARELESKIFDLERKVKQLEFENAKLKQENTKLKSKHY